MHSGYVFESGSREDPDWQCYLEFLRPSPVDRQRIENRRICFLLEKKGDPLTQAREIDHTACFPTQEARSAFVQRAAERGYRLKQVVDADQPAESIERKSAVLIFQTSEPSMASHCHFTNWRRNSAVLMTDGVLSSSRRRRREACGSWYSFVTFTAPVRSTIIRLGRRCLSRSPNGRSNIESSGISASARAPRRPARSQGSRAIGCEGI